MEEQVSKLGVVKRDRGGRRRYNEASKRALVEACLRPGVSVARKAQENGINANLLRKWITRYLLERERGPAGVPQSERILEAESDALPNSEAIAPVAVPNVVTEMTPAPFVPIVPARPATVAASSAQAAALSMALALHVRLPNGVRLDLDAANLETISTVVQMLGRLPCSGSMQG